MILHVGVSADAERAAKFLDNHADTESVAPGDGYLLVTLKKEITNYDHLPTELIAEGFRLNLFQEEEVNLESAFMALTKGTGTNF